MKTEKELEDLLDSLKVPSDEEVEAAGIRFDRRIRRLQIRRRIFWSSGVAAVILVGLLITSVWSEWGHKETVKLAERREVPSDILVPTLILSDGERVNLKNEDAFSAVTCPNIQVKENRIVYDRLPDSVEVQINTLVIPAGYIYHLTLADGTEVTLNAGSRLEYPEAFSGERREVKLSGEGYFRVAKSEKPFEVNMAEAKVRVYGTQFNVKTDRRNTVQTVLVEGKVGFIPTSGEEIRLLPGEGVEYDGLSGHIEVQPVDVQYATAWLEGVFKYRDRPLNLILEDMAAWYGIEFDVQGQAATVKLTMNLEKTTQLEETIAFIEQITNCKFKKERGMYIVK